MSSVSAFPGMTPSRASLAAAQQKPWNSLQRLKLSLTWLLILDVMFLAAMISGVKVHRDAMQKIGRSTAPSVIAAQHIKTALADMDANIANELLAQPGSRAAAAAIEEYEKQRIDLSDALISAAQNITFGEDERKPILQLQQGASQYEALVQRARDLHEFGPKDQTMMVAAYTRSQQLLDQTLMAAADKLDEVNTKAMEKVYEDQVSRLGELRFLIGLSAFCLLGLLLLTQVYLTRHTHRLINPALALATCLGVLFLLFTLKTLSSEAEQIRVAKVDAFHSLHALWQARAVAYQANSEESRYLLDPKHAEQHKQAFLKYSGKLLSGPADRPSTWAYAMAKTGDIRGAGLSGYLADQLSNITFEGEQKATDDTVAALGIYMQIDDKIRTAEEAGRHDEAILLCTGLAPNQSNGAFNYFDNKLDETININQAAFDAAVTRGLTSLDGFDPKAVAVAVIMAALMAYGLFQRIREY